MAYIFSVNNTPSTGAVAMYSLVSTLMSAGWTKPADSDGTVYSSSGVQVTSGASGTNGLGNTSAWVRLKAPAVNQGTVVNQQRELIILRGNAAGDTAWKIKYSASAGFTGGSPAATVTPTAADEVYMLGTASDSVGTSWMGTNATYRWNIIVGGAAEFYSFAAFAVTIGTITATNGIALDAMVTDSYPSLDVDPAVMYVSATTSFMNTTTVISNSTFPTATVTDPALARAWVGATSAAAAATNTASTSVGIVTALGLPTTFGSNPFTNKDDILPCIWGSFVTSFKAVKGYSTLFRLTTIAHTNLDTLDIASSGAKDRIVVGKITLPWSGTSPAL